MLPIILNEKKIDDLIQYSKRKEDIEINLKGQEIVFGIKELNLKSIHLRKNAC